MFKRKHYSQRAISTFEIIGSFIVDLFYNHFYQEAKKLRIDGRVDSVTDGYKHSVKAYLHSFENPKSYRKTIIGIHKYYYTTTKFSSISFSDCVNEIVKHFIPEDFFESTTNQQRDGILRQNLMNAVKQFSSDILCSNILDSLIDNHKDITLVRRMQDKMLQALMFEREKMFQKIFNASHKPKDSGDYTLVMKMKKEMTKLVKDNHQLTTKHKRLQQKALKLLEMVRSQRKQIAELEEPPNKILEDSEKAQEQEQIDHRRQQYDQYHEHRPEPAAYSNEQQSQTQQQTQQQSQQMSIPVDHPVHKFDNFQKEQNDKDNNTETAELVVPQEYPVNKVKPDNTYYPDITDENSLLTVPSSTLTGNISLKPEDTIGKDDTEDTENVNEVKSEASDNEGVINSVGPSSNTFFGGINID